MNIIRPSAIIVFEEEVSNELEGTIIDIETVGDFCKQYRGDSRECKNHKQVILGYLSGSRLAIHCALDMNGIIELAQLTNNILLSLMRPFYAFNCTFESSVWFHQLGVQIDFDGELQKYKFERKKEAISDLSIPNYDDPFFDVGLKCVEAWNCGNIKDAIAHNRGCLLKERDIFLKRGYRNPELVEFIQ